MTNADILTVAAAGICILSVLAVFHKKLVLLGVDRDYARTLGLRVGMLDLLLFLTIAAAVVVSVQTIGNILVLALLTAPAAGARMVTDRIFPMMVIASVIGAVSAFLGIWASWALNLPTGASIVLVSALLFILLWVFSPIRRH